jgi:hypothetical protein
MSTSSLGSGLTTIISVWAEALTKSKPTSAISNEILLSMIIS